MFIGLILAGLLVGSLVFSIGDDGSDNDISQTVDGTEGDDQLDGTEGNDLITGQEGNDVLNGEAGNDTLVGGTGSDTLNGGDGNDILKGGDQRDVLDGGAGNDRLAGGAWRDVLYGGDGNDVLNGGDAGDALHGGDGNDTIYGKSGDDLLIGGSGTDTLNGGDGDDELVGANILSRDLTVEDLIALRNDNDITGLDPVATFDLTSDDSGADILLGGAGEDYMLLGAGDTATGGAGEDYFVAYEYPADSTGLSTITDYVDGTDHIEIMHTNVTVAPVVTVASNANGDAVVSLNGEPTVIVTGAGGTLTAANVAVFSTG